MPEFGVRGSVFDSRAEQEVFHALESRWMPPYRLFAQLPLSKIFGNPPDKTTESERKFFWKTNVDYTLCDAQNAPLLSVEFDGIGGGYSKDGAYVAVNDVESDAHRKLKLDFKLALAKRAGFPFFVVSFEEAKVLESGESLTILDGIIATVLTRRRERELVGELIRDYRERHSEPNDEEIQTMVIDASTLAELEVDPFESEASRLKFDMMHRHKALRAVEVEQYSVPPVPGTNGDWMSREFFESVKVRHEALKAANRHGARVIVRMLGDRPAVFREVSIRALDDWSIALALSERIAKYLALKQACTILAVEDRAFDNLAEL